MRFRTPFCAALVAALPLGVVAAPEKPPLWEKHVIADQGKGHDGTRPADVSGDGLPDVVTGCEQSGDVIVCLHPGYKKVREKWPQAVVGKCPGVEDAVFADLDADGAVDVVASCESNKVLVHWAPKDKADYLDAAKWTQAAIPAATGGPMMFCVPAQVDGAHGTDLIVGGKGGAGIYWLEAPEKPRDLAAWKKHEIGKGRWVMSLHWTDMDGDGDKDVCYTDRLHLAWLENPGPGAGQKKPWKQHLIDGDSFEKVPTGLGQNFRFMDVIDFDGDGLEDIVAPSKNGTILYRRADRSGAKWEKETVAAVGPKAVAAGDLDGDGKKEVVSSMPYHIFKFDPGAKKWGALPLVAGIGKSDLVQLLDLDGDGDLDVLCSSEANGITFWLENPHVRR